MSPLSVGVTIQQARRRAARRSPAPRHGSVDQDDPEVAEAMTTITRVMAAGGTPAYSRTRAELEELFGDAAPFDLVAPGLVDVTRWPAGSADAPGGVYAAVARVP